MTGFLLRALLAAFGLYLASRYVHGVHIDNGETLLLAALLLGVVNAIVRPIVFILTLPLTILTLGLFLLVVNAGFSSLRGLSRSAPHLDHRVDHGLAGLGPDRPPGVRALRAPLARLQPLHPAIHPPDHPDEGESP